jgi:hypothetical protein
MLPLPASAGMVNRRNRSRFVDQTDVFILDRLLSQSRSASSAMTNGRLSRTITDRDEPPPGAGSRDRTARVVKRKRAGAERSGH